MGHLQHHHAHRGSWVGLNGEWTLVEYINFALWVEGSSFTGGEAHEDPTVQPHLPSITTPEPDPAPTPTVEMEQVPPLYSSVSLLHPSGFTGGTLPWPPGPSMMLLDLCPSDFPLARPYISSAVGHPSPGYLPLCSGISSAVYSFTIHSTWSLRLTSLPVSRSSPALRPPPEPLPPPRS